MAQLTIQQAFELALQHHQAGRFREAESLYNQILAAYPAHFAAIHYLGLIEHQRGNHDTAVDLMRKGLALSPDIPDAHNNLGLALVGKGALDEAIAAYRQAIALNPEYAEAHSNLGNALRDNGQLDQAIAAYRRAIEINPNVAGVHSNLGNALKDAGDFDGAIAALHRALELDPAFADAHNNLGNALRASGQLPQAIERYGIAIALDANRHQAHNNLGNALRDSGRLDEAIIAYREAIALRGDYAEAHSNLGNALNDKGRTSDAIAAYRRAIALKPNYPEAHYNLSIALEKDGQLDAAIDAYREAIRLDPGLSKAYNNLGNALKDIGAVEQAIAAYQEAISLAPAYTIAHSNLVYSLYFHPGYDARQIGQAHRLWDERHAQPLLPTANDGSQKLTAGHANNPDPDRRLRVGYLSPDFRMHVVGQNLLPLFRQHDHREFEITCYAHVANPDEVTKEFQRLADHWRDIVGKTDQQVAEQVRRDEIDILVDLTLHMLGNRLLVFARKPAPIQLTYLAYCGTSGMRAMDYRFSDPYFDPDGTDLSCYAEQTIRLPHTYWCYQPRPAPPPAPPPVLDNGFITFGCQNNFAKVSRDALALWAEILSGVPGSRLIIHSRPGSHRAKVIQSFASAGIAPNRIGFVGEQTFDDYMQTYCSIDIALDPFPYAGGITTLDALWMGVPVVTLSGETSVGRGGRSILSNLGLTELIAFNREQYKQIAIGLAYDRPRMARIRSELRDRMLASPLLDAQTFARDVEAAYRRMWQQWCRANADLH